MIFVAAAIVETQPLFKHFESNEERKICFCNLLGFDLLYVTQGLPGIFGFTRFRYFSSDVDFLPDP